jgi:hypothetical protein
MRGLALCISLAVEVESLNTAPASPTLRKTLVFLRAILFSAIEAIVGFDFDRGFKYVYPNWHWQTHCWLSHCRAIAGAEEFEQMLPRRLQLGKRLRLPGHLARAGTEALPPSRSDEMREGLKPRLQLP